MFIFLMGDGDADATTPQMPPDVATAIGLVAYHTTRTVFGAASATAFDRTPRHERFKSNGFVALAGCQDESHQVFVARRTQMNFGAEPPLGCDPGLRLQLLWANRPRADGRDRWCHRHSEWPSPTGQRHRLAVERPQRDVARCRLGASDRSGWPRCTRSHSVRAHCAREHPYAAATRCR